MPTVPYRRIGPVNTVQPGMTVVYHDWSPSYEDFYRILDVSEGGRVLTSNSNGTEYRYYEGAFSGTDLWIQIEDEFWGEGPMKRKVTRRPKSGFGLFVKKLDDHDKTLDIHPA